MGGISSPPRGSNIGSGWCVIFGSLVGWGASAGQATTEYSGLLGGRRGLMASIRKRRESDGAGRQTSTKSTPEGGSHGNTIIRLRDGRNTQLSLEKLYLARTPVWWGICVKVKRGVVRTGGSRSETNGSASSLLTESLCEDGSLNLLVALGLGVLGKGQYER